MKAFSFLFCTACDAKSTKYGERWYTEWLQNNMQKENRLIQCVYTQWKSTKKTNLYCEFRKSVLIPI